MAYFPLCLIGCVNILKIYQSNTWGKAIILRQLSVFTHEQRERERERIGGGYMAIFKCMLYVFPPVLPIGTASMTSFLFSCMTKLFQNWVNP